MSLAEPPSATEIILQETKNGLKNLRESYMFEDEAKTQRGVTRSIFRTVFCLQRQIFECRKKAVEMAPQIDDTLLPPDIFLSAHPLNISLQVPANKELEMCCGT